MNLKKDIDYKKKILVCLAENVSGLTVTDISKRLDVSRNTIYRYIGVLDEKNLVLKKKIGNYNLYFIKEESMMPRDTIIRYYHGLVSSFRDFIGNDKSKFKQLGRKLATNVSDLINGDNAPQLKELEQYNNKFFLIAFGKIFGNFFDPFQGRVELKDTELNEKDTKAIYYFLNSDLLEADPDNISHYYMVSGFVEEKIKNIFNRNVKCDIIDYKISSSNGENSFKMSLELIE